VVSTGHVFAGLAGQVVMESPTFLAKVKRLVIIAMFSDDDLMERLVLKGGNLLDLVYQVSARASLDVDFSVDGDLESREELERKMTRTLTSTFADEGFRVFDVKVEAVPPEISDDVKDFWGGYNLLSAHLDLIFSEFPNDCKSAPIVLWGQAEQV
jgi:hypothetical protein